jgi:ATP-dependent Clp protease ATP-binding subunit ClpX
MPETAGSGKDPLQAGNSILRKVQTVTGAGHTGRKNSRMNDIRNSSDNNRSEDEAGTEEFCSLCRRSSSNAGKMLHLPNGMPVCSDCMQNMMNMASHLDYSSLLSDPSRIQEMLSHIQSPMPSAEPERNRPDGTGAEAPAEHPAEADLQPAGGMPVQTVSGETADADASSDGSHTKDTDQNDKKKEPTISFVNLGDIFGGMGMQGAPRVKKKKEPGPKPVFSIDDMPAPHRIKAKLDEYVIGQEHAKKTLSVAVYNHYKRVKTGHMDDIEIEKSNILMIGPTGCGKTYLVRTLARLLDVPLAIADATSITEAGYIGDDIESVISKLLDAADNDVEKAERGIVFIDEIDKIAKKKNTTSRDINGESVQQGMLKLLEGAEVEVPVGASSKNAMVPMTTVNTRNILFICGGAFPDLDNIIKERLTKQSGFGYNAELKDRYDDDPDLLSHVTNEDLRSFGFIPEFIGRLPIVCTLQKLDRAMLVQILTEPKNAITKQYRKLLELDEVDLEFTDEALETIADKALEKETGARALRAIIEGFMMDIMYEVPKDENIGRVTITKDYVEGKGGPLIEIRTAVPESETARIEQRPESQPVLQGAQNI